jgi:hypothetical protein
MTDKTYNHRSDLVAVIDILSELGYERMKAPMNPNPSQPWVIKRPWKLWLMACTLTIMVHGLFLGTALMGTLGHKRHELYVSNDMSMRSGNAGEFVSTLIWVDESKDIPSSQSLASPQAQSQSIAPPVAPSVDDASIEDSQQSDTDSASGTNSTESGVGKDPVTLEGLYKRQVKARIDRALEDSGNKRVALGKCMVKVVQTQQGQVTDVELQRCIALPAWKDSLALAIHRAAPLPAPPDPTVFSQELELEF